MSRTIFLVLIIYALLLTGLATLHGELLGLALLFVIYLLAGFWRAPDKLDLVVQRKLSTERAMPGEDVVVTLEVTNRGADIDELQLADVLPTGLNVRVGSPHHLLSLKKVEPTPGHIPSTGRAAVTIQADQRRGVGSLRGTAEQATGRGQKRSVRLPAPDAPQLRHHPHAAYTRLFRDHPRAHRWTGYRVLRPARIPAGRPAALDQLAGQRALQR